MCELSTWVKRCLHRGYPRYEVGKVMETMWAAKATDQSHSASTPIPNFIGFVSWPIAPKEIHANAGSTATNLAGVHNPQLTGVRIPNKRTTVPTIDPFQGWVYFARDVEIFIRRRVSNTKRIPIPCWDV
jgi:hypothetical protein